MIGLVFHGPEVIDSGEAEDALSLISSITPHFRAYLGGISGKTAVIDAGLTDVIDITRHKLPSELIRELITEGCEFILLLNHAKTRESGLALGNEIFRRVSSLVERGFSLVQIDYNGFIVPWKVEKEHIKIYRQILGAFGFEELAPPSGKEKISKVGNTIRRRVEGVRPGEKILVDGVVIGIAEREDVFIIEEDGRIVGIEGGRVIEENLLKLDSGILEDALIKSVRFFREHPPRIKGSLRRDVKSKRVALLFKADRVFEVLDDVGGVVTIGDDTTSIVGDIARRFGVPIIGITDGDLDGLIREIGSGKMEEFERIVPGNSLIIRVQPERDDMIGWRIREEIFGGRDVIEIDLDTLKKRVRDIVKDNLVWMVEVN